MPRRDPDLSRFQPVIDDMLKAFSQDGTSYAVAMSARAVTILRKRASHNARSRVRAAEATARQLCEDGPAFVCAAAAPCGVGRLCRYAPADLRDVAVEDGPTRTSRRTQRPQLGPDGQPTTYDLETAVPVVAEGDEVLAGLRRPV
jgi:hypothetical protein